MKHFFCSLFSYLFAFCGLSYGQHSIEVGVRFVPQATTFRYTTGIPGVSPLIDYLKVTSPYYFRVRTAQGVGVVYYPVQRLRLGADLLYSLQGGGYEQRKTNLNYLTLPLWVGLNSRPRRRIGFTFQSGVQLAWLMNAKNKYSDGTQLPIKADVSRTTWGIAVAMGVKFKVNQLYLITTQLYWYSDFSTVARTNREFGAYNYVYPGIRIAIDQNLSNFKRKTH